MKQTASIISTYSADVFGICSALFELGGMTVMHDASGCNSTYHTHDEPRWYDMDSMVYISGLTEMEAIMGDDNKLIQDIITAAKQLSPQFIAIAGTPIPMMIGTDFSAIASLVERQTGIPAFGFATNGMHSYLSGISMAFKTLAEKMVDKNVHKSNEHAINILGVTPLDFSVNSSVDSMKNLLENHGFHIISTWAMGSTLNDIQKSGRASVNLVVSYCGLAAAKELQKTFGTPYVIGTPCGEIFTTQLLRDLKQAASTGESKTSYTRRKVTDMTDITIIGESILSGSLAAAINATFGRNVQVICPLETEPQLLTSGDYIATDEDDLLPHLKNSKILIADPLYRPIATKDCMFIPLPHEAFSGRIYRNEIPDLVTNFETIFKL